MDTRTILLAAALTVLANGGVLVLIQYLLPAAERGPAKAWQLGTVLIAAGCVAFSFKAALPQALELTAPNALIMSGLAAYWYAVGLLCRQSLGLATLLGPVIIATAAVYVFHIPFPDAWMRILFVALAWMLFMFGSATTLHRHVAADTPGSQRALAWLFYAVGLCTALRLFYYSQVDLSAGFDATDNRHWVTRATPLLALALPVLGSTAFILLCYERIRTRARRQTEALGYISHDLRAPAATVKGYVNLLRTSLPAGQASHLQAIERSTDYQISLIDELVEYSRQELRPLSIRLSATDMDAFVAKLFEHGRSLCLQHGNQFSISADSPIPKSLVGDERRLSQVLLNLISNAAAFTRQGKVSLSLSCAGKGKDVLLHFSVQDDGPGIPAIQQAHVFDAFEQHQLRDGSVGLGLHIAHRIVDNMGGELRLDSSPGAGACFSFCLQMPVLSEETFLPNYETGFGAGLHVNQAAPVIVPPSIQPAVYDLAEYARLGEITRIEQWLAANLDSHPGAEQFLEQIEQAAAALDLARIERLASRL
ncbi:sensor histidine kinase [Pusillimonas noertemannii]|uniref:sensor histidine kinase n=1 Tax=Pusillimonas noertemannii TaxID=305977 RepID=UPI00036AE5C9|nr:HAMP domain-containing sensor histidine kinase [Pusillimonas noertemannii]